MVDIQKLRGWFILERQTNKFGIYHINTTSKEADLGVIFPIGDCEFKNIKTGNVYAIADSLYYKKDVNAQLLNEALNRLGIFNSLDVTEISWQKDDRLFFIKRGNGSEKTLIFNFSTNSWEQ